MKFKTGDRVVVKIALPQDNDEFSDIRFEGEHGNIYCDDPDSLSSDGESNSYNDIMLVEFDNKGLISRWMYVRDLQPEELLEDFPLPNFEIK